MSALRRLGWEVWFILALALAVRLVAGFLISARIEPGTDALDYERIAQSIAAGDGYPIGQAMFINGGPSAFRPPGQPYMLSGFFYLFEDGRQAARLFQALLGTVTVALLGCLAWQVFKRREVALAAMLIGAIYVPLIVMGVPLMSESLFFPSLLGSLAAALQWRETRAVRWAVLAGTLAGVALLARAAGVLLIPPLLLLLLSGLSLRAALAPLAALAGTALILAPWTIRNFIEFDALVPVSTQGGLSLSGAYNEETKADPAHFWRPPQSTEELVGLFKRPGFDEAELSDELTDRSLDLIKDDPFYVAEFGWDNIGRMLEIREQEPRDYDAQLLGFSGADAKTTTFRAIFHLGAVSFFGLAGLFFWAALTRRVSAMPWQLWLVPVIAILLGSALAGAPRYRLPADLILILASAPAALALFESLRGRVARVRQATPADTSS